MAVQKQSVSILYHKTREGENSLALIKIFKSSLSIAPMVYNNNNINKKWYSMPLFLFFLTALFVSFVFPIVFSLVSTIHPLLVLYM